MNLALKSVRDTFIFIKKYPISLVFVLIISLLTLSISSLFTAVARGSYSLQVTQQKAVQSLPVDIVILGLLVFLTTFVFSLIQIGGLTLIVSDSLKGRGSVLVNAFKKSLRRLLSIFVAMVITGLIILLPLAPAFVLGGMPLISIVRNPTSVLNLESFTSPTFSFAIVAFAVGLVASFYLLARFWLVYPILMIENKKPIVSIKLSWGISKGNVLSMWLALVLLLFLIALPSILVGIGVDVLNIGAVSLLWNIVYGTYAGTFSGVLTTIFYFNLKNKKINL